MSHHFDVESSDYAPRTLRDRKSFELPGSKLHYNPDRPGQVDHIFLDLVI